MIPYSLHIISILAVALGFICAAGIAADEIRHPQHMWIMNLVWPLVALFGTALTIWAYVRFGRSVKPGSSQGSRQDKEIFPVAVGKGTTHCGSGCALGDICAEWLAFVWPAIAVWFGWHSLFGEKLFAVWILDFVFAFVFGIAFQYFSIVPMRGLGVAEGLKEALKADTLSLTAWQIGMYGFMALSFFALFRGWLGTELKVNSFEFWFMMQIAMLCGFVTSYPVNWWLLRAGIKEPM